ncbi:MAG: Rpn family recombination-promoting nuclease/putative transposase [Bacteroidales bacterium]|nr:Rpn family recombination-promoting nuclease/putative transposase [Bacteroidales bacterium]
MKNRPPQLKEEIFKLLFESAEIANFTPEEKAKYERDMTTERDIRNYISCARQEGREEGLEAGKKEGIKEGVINTKIEIAKALFAKGIGLETIASCTGLSIDEIEKLK